VRTQLRRSMRSSHSLSGSWFFYAVLITLLLGAWSLSGVHKLDMAGQSWNSLLEIAAPEKTLVEYQIGHHQLKFGHSHPTENLSINSPDAEHLAQHDVCADHCISVFISVVRPLASIKLLSPTVESCLAHWQTWYAELPLQPPEQLSFAVRV